jgi:serine/threonine-protein kinase
LPIVDELMALKPGARIGPYEVATQIGEGGMGEVYRAMDMTLGRTVAIKVLPDAFASDAERLARFEREARNLAALNHPNIAQIYGVERSTPVPALVMELVEGPTLADRIARGPIPVDEALPIARQIAEALEAAHEQGIVHRDLKPANIKVRDDGTVKVLDFGLAKAVVPVAAISSNQSLSPTITTPAMTQMGVILGTAAYMAPEQAKGRPADKRTDVWAFGCVLYEMLTGRRAFEGEDLSDTLANILKSAPDWTLLPSDLPAPIRNLVTMCVEKDRRRRIGEASVAKFLLSEDATRVVSDAPAAAADAALTPVRPWPLRRFALVSASLFLIGGLAGAATVWLTTRGTPPQLARFEVMTTGSEALALGGLTRDIAISPDGTGVVYRSGSSQLFIRPIDQLKPTLLTASATSLPANPFFSPDGQWVGFHTPVGVWKVAVSGGPSLLVSQLAGVPRGASWGLDGTIVFAKEGEPGLRRVSAGGGEATVLTRPDPGRGEASHIWPEFLPRGRAVLFTIEPPGGAGGAAQIAVLDLETGMSKILLRGGSDARYAPSGHLVYTAAGTLRAVPFDLDRLEVSGAPVPVIPDVATSGAGGANFALADNGTLVYAPAGTNSTIAGPRTLVWVDRQGREEPIDAPPRSYLYPRLSPDGTRVALDIRDEQSDIWLFDLTRNNLRRVTFDPGIDQFPVWTPDGRRIVFSTSRGGRSGRTISSQAADGSGFPEPLSRADDEIRFPTAISPDGTRLIIMEADSGATGVTADILALRLDGNGEVEPLIQTNAGERNAEISPNGRWLAYQSDESGRLEVYVRPFPAVNSGKTQVSINGGGWPLWSRDGRELFYLGPDRAVMSTRVEPGDTWAGSTPTKIVNNPYLKPPDALFGRTYDVSPDGKRFLMIKPSTGQTSSFILVQNWLEELKRLVPTN